jgi:hypothetical protein
MQAVKHFDLLASLGLPQVTPEPELVVAQIDRARAHSLGRIVTDLINEHEPMLRAEWNGATVIVCELGGKPILKIAITPEGKSS